MVLPVEVLVVLGLDLINSVDYTFVKYFRCACGFVFKYRLVVCWGGLLRRFVLVYAVFAGLAV